MDTKVCRTVALAVAFATTALPFMSRGASALKSQTNPAYVQTASAKQAATMSNKSTALARIRLSFDGKQAEVELNDNPASRDFVSMLPLTLNFRDYNGVEKVAYPPRKLSTKGASFGLTPSVGDFALYAPWGNLVAYYRGFRHSGDLVHLGRFTSGIEELSKMDGEFSVRIEAVQ
ncbi:cyclophilin-like fold protein [Paraburkholderia graminis]|nr:cyclophilin-like fold protein [Paraburkholderia graminis]